MAIPIQSSAPASSSASMLSNRHPGKYREAREFPYRLRSAVSVYLGDRQFLEGFELLNSILVAGASTPEAPAAFVPPTSYFELAATLIVHPQYTTRAKSTEDSRAADEALRFLRDAVRIVGPVNANLAQALQFRGSRVARARTHRKRRRGQEDFSMGGRLSSDDENEEDEQLASPFTGEKSVFAQREGGFWYVVGWAFNCSVKHKQSWERWKVWLDIMIEILEEDFAVRLRLMDEGVSKGERPSEDAQEKFNNETIITQYLDGISGRNGRRRVVGAILANGDEKAMREFGEVWINETKEKKLKTQDDLFEKRRTINLDEDEWGDYDVNEDEDEVVQDTDINMADANVKTEDFGGIESIKLRQRLLFLLASTASNIPLKFTDLEELFDTFAELLRPQPLSIFSQIVATFTLPPHILAALLTDMLLPFLAAPPRKPHIFELTQEHMIKHYLPHAANSTSTIENAKMSLLLEHLLLSMQACNRLNASEDLNNATERGIKAREKKAIGDARRKDKGRSVEEMSAKAVLDMSSERIRMTLAMLDGDKYGTVANSTRIPEIDELSSQLSDLAETLPSDGDGDVALRG